MLVRQTLTHPVWQARTDGVSIGELQVPGWMLSSDSLAAASATLALVCDPYELSLAEQLLVCV